MSYSLSTPAFGRLSPSTLFGVLFAGAACIGVLASPHLALAQSADHTAKAVPDFTGTWQRDDPYMQFMPPQSGQGPLREHPLHTRESQGDLSRPFIADHTDPLLKPWAAEVIKELTYRQLVDQEEILPAHSLCWPSGVPGSLRMREPVQLLQMPDQVTIIYQRDHQVRRIHMDVPHSDDPPTTWYGESVGHYDGDALVVDTIGLNDGTAVDWFGTPHSDAIHVVERYRVIDEGQAIEVAFTVEDSNTFTRPWSATVHYRRLNPNTPFGEVVCSENNKNASTGGDYPIPIAEKIDF